MSEKFRQLLLIRNTIVHGFILLGWNSDYGDLNPNSMLIRQQKIKENILDKKSKLVSVSDLEMFSHQANFIFEGYVQVSAYISHYRLNYKKDQALFISNLNNILNNIGKIDF